MFAALLDTNVLYPSLQRDFLLSLAIQGLYRPLWSEAILAELLEIEVRKRRARGESEAAAAVAATHLLGRLRDAFDDAIVVGWEPLDGSYGLPDPDDEHVLAAAVVGGAGALVTSNLRDFPTHAVPSGIQVLPPAQFAADSVAVDPGRALAAVEEMSRRFTRPPRTVESLLDTLGDRYAMAEAVDLLRGL